ncbi:MAG: hypothetical protein PHV06_09850, partial [bacterium]|nr:hypothetical protein [bacterium]
MASLSENDRIPGSPQRSICRQLFKARNGKLYFIQGFDESGERRKNKINSVLETLKEEGIPRIQLPIKTIEDKNLVKYNGLTWQIFEYIEGMELKRPDYQEEPWRGRKFAEILKDLKSVTSAVFGKLPKEPKFME